MPSIHDGQPVLQGIRAMCLRNNNTEVLTAGSDGQIIIWDITGPKIGRVMQSVQVCRPALGLCMLSVCSW